MYRTLFLAAVLFTGCKPAAATFSTTVVPSGPSGGPAGSAPEASGSLVDARKGFKSKLIPDKIDRRPVKQPPPKVFEIVKYDAAAGKLPAYLTPDPKDGKKHPAIIWIHSYECNSIDDVWTPDEADRTAESYRQAGIVMMFPSLRGGNDNPGQVEGFLGEVDDVLAAADFLARQPYVDPARIYLGGYDTGGTLALLTAECSDRFRAVFSFAPVDDVAEYDRNGFGLLPFDVRDPREIRLRSPGYWLSSIKSPVFVIEGLMEGLDRGHGKALQALAGKNNNPKVTFVLVRGATPFSVLAPANKVIAQKILKDDGPQSNLTITEEELNRAAGK
jgi:dienelactone hydrolase